MIKKLLLLVALTTAPAAAQSSFSVLTGICVVTDSTIGDVAYASTAPILCPHIIINPALMSKLPPAVQLFFIHHEIAHISLKHGPFSPDLSMEEQAVEVIRHQFAADCTAARLMKVRWSESLDAATQWFAKPPPEFIDLLVPSGPQRAANIVECIK